MTKKAAIEVWLTAIEMEKSGVIATILQTVPAQGKLDNEGLFISTNHLLVGSLVDAYLEEQVIQLVEKKLTEKKTSSETKVFQLLNKQEVAVFVDVFVPQPDLERIIARADGFKEKVIIEEYTYVIVMNHHLERNREALTFSLNSQAPYIDILGSRSRRDRIIQKIKSSRLAVTESYLSRLYNPIGLDMGARTPEEIAMSIAAEIIAKKNCYPGGFLKDSEFIHHASAVSGKNE